MSNITALERLLNQGGNRGEMPFVPTQTEYALPRTDEPQDEQFLPRVYRQNISVDFDKGILTTPINVDQVVPAGLGVAITMQVDIPMQTEAVILKWSGAVLNRYSMNLEDDESVVTMEEDDLLLFNRLLVPKSQRTEIDAMLGWVPVIIHENINESIHAQHQTYYVRLITPMDGGPFLGINGLDTMLKAKSGSFSISFSMVFNGLQHVFSPCLGATVNWDNVEPPVITLNYWYYKKSNAYVQQLLNKERELSSIASTFALRKQLIVVPANSDKFLNIGLDGITGPAAYILLAVRSAWSDATYGKPAVIRQLYNHTLSRIQLIQADRTVLDYYGDPLEESNSYVRETFWGEEAVYMDEAYTLYILPFSLSADLTNPAGFVRSGLSRNGYSINITLSETPTEDVEIKLWIINHAALQYAVHPETSEFGVLKFSDGSVLRRR